MLKFCNLLSDLVMFIVSASWITAEVIQDIAVIIPEK